MQCPVGKAEADLQPQQQQPSKQDSDEFLLEDLWAVARGCVSRHIMCCWGHTCPARLLALDRQRPDNLAQGHGARLRRVTHQPTVGSLGSPLLH